MDAQVCVCVCVCVCVYVCVYESVNSMVVIIIGNDLSYLSSNPKKGFLHFTLSKYLWERHEPSYSPFFYG